MPSPHLSETHIRLFKYRIPILIASVCLGIAGEQFGWGVGLPIVLIAALQLFLLGLSYL